MRYRYQNAPALRKVVIAAKISFLGESPGASSLFFSCKYLGFPRLSRHARQVICSACSCCISWVRDTAIRVSNALMKLLCCSWVKLSHWKCRIRNARDILFENRAAVRLHCVALLVEKFYIMIQNCRYDTKRVFFVVITFR